MTILNPAAGLIAAAVGVPALLLLYFLKLRRRPVRVSSTLLWEQAAQDLQVNTPFRWLRFSWLLVLQLLALGCLITAIARPALDQSGPLGHRVVLLIDRSASMSARDGLDLDGKPCSRLDEAKRRAADLIDQQQSRGSGGDTQNCVATLAASSRTLTPFTQDFAALRESIDAIEPSDQPGRLDEALRLAQALAADKLEEDSSPEPLSVILFSDGGFAPGDLPPTKGVALRFERVGPAPAPSGNLAGGSGVSSGSGFDNVGIVALSAKRDYDDPATLRVFTRVQSAAAAPRTATLRLTLAGGKVEDRLLQLPGFTASSPNAPRTTPVPGESAASFMLNTTEGGVLIAQLLEPDLLASDNTAGLVLPPASKPRIMLVAPGPRGDEADPFLLSLLRSFDTASLRVVDAAMYEQLAAGIETDRAAGEGTASPDLVLFDRVEPKRLPKCPSLSFGAGLPLPGVTVQPATGQAAEAAARVIAWRRDHPLLRYVGLDSIIVQPPMILTILDPAQPATPPVTPRPPLAPKPTILAETESGPLMALFDDRGVRRVLVAFALERSNWGPQVSFPVFLANTIDYLTLRAEAATGRWFRTDQAITVQPAPGTTEVTVIAPGAPDDPDRERARVLLSARIPAQSAGQPVTLGIIDRAGLYTLRGSADPIARVAVNLADANEALLSTSDRLDIPGGGRVMANTTTHAAPREIWHWFILAAVVLLTLEWFLYAWRMRA